MRFQNSIGARLSTNINGMPTTAKMPCFSTWSKGFWPPSSADVADSTMTRPKPVSRSAAEAMRRNSLGTGWKARPSETRADSPRRAGSSSGA
ncbi:hypothetical protein SRABI128_02085 [Microbacterium sp. Bi128]|nr:hypothetical protein SRABI128_02085 [Microbacterium sp. Bi128]